jgi:hypothetical protein
MVYPLLHNVELSKDPALISLDIVVQKSRSDNLTKVIMEVLMISGGFVKRPNCLEVHMFQG